MQKLPNGGSQTMNSKRKTIGRIIAAIISIAVVVGATYAVAVLSKFYYNFESSIGDEALAMMGKMKLRQLLKNQIQTRHPPI